MSAEDAGEHAIVDTGVGEPDRLARLWTPYRMTYLAEAVKRVARREAESLQAPVVRKVRYGGI